MTPDEEIAVLKAENAALRKQMTGLVARVQELEARLAKDSHNSGKPPSSDGMARKTRSLRQRSGKKPGGQIGRHGQTLRLVATPDAVVEHRPTHCTGCQAPLSAAAPVVLRERRQVHELPPVRLVVTEHQALHVRCLTCQAVSVGAFPIAVPSRVQYGPHLRALCVYLVEQQLLPYGRVRELLGDLVGTPVSVGTLVEWVQEAAVALEPVEAQMKAALRQAPVLHNDETGVRQAGRLAWMHVASTKLLTHYAVHPKRGAEATAAIGILPGYRGVSVHDGWKPYWTHTSCRHALCNIHHLRELTFLHEHYHQPWAKELKDLLREMKGAADQARADGVAQLPWATRKDFVARYDALLAAGLAANPPPARAPHQRGRLKQSPARNVIDRLWVGRDEALAFLDDLHIPFDNNQAERDLRMLKVQQKISGCFRSIHGGVAFARIRGYLSSLKKQRVKGLAALESVFVGQPLSPSFG
jgi:transposase